LWSPIVLNWTFEETQMLKAITLTFALAVAGLAVALPGSPPLIGDGTAKAQASQIPERFSMGASVFEYLGNNAWVERRANNVLFQFTQQGPAVGGYIYLIDFSRVKEGDPGRPFHLRIPIRGGIVQWSWPNPLQWQDLGVASPQ
jgi:hypothetical protein